MTVTIKDDGKTTSKGKIYPLMMLSVTTVAHQGKHTTSASQTEASRCIREECQLWWFCNGSTMQRTLSAGDALKIALMSK